MGDDRGVKRGRPKKPDDERLSQNITIRITLMERLELLAEARQKGITFSELARRKLLTQITEIT